MNSYDKNIRLERKFAKQIKAIIGMSLIKQDPIMDRNFATDFVMFGAYRIQVACRLRTYRYYLNEKYRNQFTIRCKLSSGQETELGKIRKGYCDYIFYGFVDEAEENIIKYFIGDLKVFRDYEGGMKCERHKNKDSEPSDLAAWNIREFPREFIIKEYEKPRTEEEILEERARQGVFG